jgi:glycolate oxidase FAD binding subunit
MPMSAHDGLATALEALVGTDHLLVDDDAAMYTVDGVSPSLAVWPADAEQVMAVMRLADEYQATICPRGGGSHLTLGGRPERVDILLGLHRLNAQLAHEPADMTVTAQAGLRLADLQSTLGAQGQFLALDPPAATTTTLGGIIAANTSGPRRLLYGTARDLVLGMSVITIDGKRTKSGASVVKNVTGYDLNKLYIGSMGTLAVIVELTCKLHPLPSGEHTVAIGFSHDADILPLLQALLRVPLRLSSLEVLNAAAATHLMQQAGLAAIDAPYLLVARVEGAPEIAERQAQRMLGVLHALPLSGTLSVTPLDMAEQRHFWRALEEFPIAAHAAAPQGAMSKVSLQMSDLPVFFRTMQAAATGADSAWPILAHAASGIVYINILPAAEAGSEPAEMLQHLRLLDDCVEQLKGRRVIERAPADIKRQCDIWGSPGDDFALMRAIKAVFDPHNRLNPGRFLGGL